MAHRKRASDRRIKRLAVIECMPSSSNPKMRRAASIALFGVLLALVVYVFFPIECPYCHNSDANVKGACVKIQRDGYCKRGLLRRTLQSQFLPLVRPRGLDDQPGCLVRLKDDGQQSHWRTTGSDERFVNARPSWCCHEGWMTNLAAWLD